GRREADFDPRHGPEERREADDRDRARPRRRQPDARRADARHHPQHAAQEDAAAADQGLVSKTAPGKVGRALISVSDKSGIVELARTLSALGIEILSTGGTARLLEKEGL